MSDFKHPTRANSAAGKWANSRSDAGVIFIGSLDPGETALTVEAQYNPKELQVDQNVPWQKKNQANKAPKPGGGSAPKGDPAGIELEFTGAEGRSMTIELLFDGYETGTSVAPQVDMLYKLASVIKPGSTKEAERRPRKCVCTWGDTVKAFSCVIASLSVKYTMFSEDGDPLRATCTVKLMEADALSLQQDPPATAGAQ